MEEALASDFPQPLRGADLHRFPTGGTAAPPPAIELGPSGTLFIDECMERDAF
jgi:hypothetical protein